MPTTERMKPISLFVPFEPIERRSKDEPLIVSGYCFVNETVEGEGGVVLERAAMEAATPEYMQRRTIREMHGPHAAGVAESVDWNERGCHLTARIVDPVARLKVEEGVYRGFSIKVRPTQRLGNRVKALRIMENSLVDDGADPDCNDLVIHRSDGFDPNALVEVEVLEESPDLAPGDATPPADAGAAGPAGVEAPSAVPASDAVPEPSGLPGQEAGAPEGGDLSPERLAIRDALVAQGISTLRAAEMATEVEVVPAPAVTASTASVTTNTIHVSPEEVQRGIGEMAAVEGLPAPIPGPGVTEYEQLQVAVQRAQSSGTVPVRENLDKLRPATPQQVNSDLSEPPRGEYRVEQAPTGMWCVYDPSGNKLGEFETEAAARKRVAEAKDAMKDAPERAALLQNPTETETASPTISESAIERVIKHEDGKWCVYSEDGKLLGKHDTKAEAEDQLQAIEIEKHKDEKGATKPKERAAAVEDERAEIAALLERSTTTWASVNGQPIQRDVPGGFVRVLFPAESDKGYWRAYRKDAPPVGNFATLEEATAALAPFRESPERHSLMRLRDGSMGIMERFDSEAEARARFEALTSNTSPVSGEQPDEPTALARVELTRALRLPLSETLELNRLLDTATKRIRELENMPLEQQRPVVRYERALTRETFSHLGSEADAETERLRKTFAEAKAAAEAARDAGDRDTRDREMQRMMVAQGELSLRGVRV